MPELPEIETIRTGLTPWLIGRRICRIEHHVTRLRWPLPVDAMQHELPGQTIRALHRRGKYLLWELDTGHLVIHLGMSGRLFRDDPQRNRTRHDHLFWILDDESRICLHDPRRFGAVLWIKGIWQQHPLFISLGREPLESDFDAAWLWQNGQGRRVALHAWLIQGRVVVGVGNIYAAEALHLAGLHPARPAHSLSQNEAQALVDAVRQVLNQAIAMGGTTVRDYRQSDGSMGYFAVALQVYGRENLPCPRCATPIARLRLGQRSVYYCPDCQPAL
ncbi:MAG: bifunctional DNA-formamidopyrimidine glycosylase/DNA-(apurinic or apyrimidinic site) lyase [Magnetococcales bacterium]|nr:bifunctional DNA-formamidopyrimidine glycosylase/DNA-(apurinic or apyrimidinic site) lyase [Magnetococcales bacterium]NGZ07216.1 bifunctional DNA-formamidopyrimidine glycosylase/DNA-(apurinic or apyrimidinic site) lyase [Magnetococcales bacterium]